MKTLFLSFLLSLSFFSAIGQSCAVTSLLLETQEDIDNFLVNYPNCTEIVGNVWIGGLNDNITTLLPLINITKVTGSLVISGIDVNDFSGLNNLDTITGDLQLLDLSFNTINGLDGLSYCGSLIADLGGSVANVDLPNLNRIGGDCHIYGSNHVQGFDSLEIIDGKLLIALPDSLYGFNKLKYINGNLEFEGSDPDIIDAFKSLEVINGNLDLGLHGPFDEISGFRALKRITGNLILATATEISSIEWLDGLRYIGGDFFIGGTFELQNLVGLESLDTVNGALTFDFIFNLTDLSPIANIDPTTPSNVMITYCPNLKLCGNPFICGYLATGNPVTIDENGTYMEPPASSCSSIALVLESCNLDDDGDTVPNSIDNCNLPNPYQTDLNNNGIGDVCETNPINMIMFENAFLDVDSMGLIMKSPDGKCFHLKIDNNGVLITVEIDCPAP